MRVLWGLRRRRRVRFEDGLGRIVGRCSSRQKINEDIVERVIVRMP
jgi:hypothetical protein